MFYLDQEARNGLWNFISAHFSMIYWVHGDIYKNEPLAFLIEDSQIEQIEPYFMARIVDVKNSFNGFRLLEQLMLFISSLKILSLLGIMVSSL